ncbi:MAG: radical SAM protein [Planctomycetia bacterium]|nr:radical SAM protein [Planctomycetia bacterium]
MVEEPIPTRNHPSRFGILKYAYPVISRRAGGVSIGINLSPNHECTFRCLYCQVPSFCAADKAKPREVDTELLTEELRFIAHTVLTGSLFDAERFRHVPQESRVLRDFALSGDGEPTLSPSFPDAVATLVKVRRELALDSLKLVLITNATRLNEPEVQKSLELLMNNGGEIWAKLDAGTQDDYLRINRSSVPFDRILSNIEETARRWPIWIQTMALRQSGRTPEVHEFDSYCQRVQTLLAAGAKIRGIQLYTVARTPADPAVNALTDEEMDALAAQIKRQTGLLIRVYYSK